jgi:hypothetical protein
MCLLQAVLLAPTVTAYRGKKKMPFVRQGCKNLSEGWESGSDDTG